MIGLILIITFTTIMDKYIMISFTEGQHRDGDIRLEEGSYQWEGRVEIYFSGTWGTITDSEWSRDDAQVVCRKLGYFKPGSKLICSVC